MRLLRYFKGVWPFTSSLLNFGFICEYLYVINFENNIWHCFILSPLINQREKSHYNFDVNKKY